MDVFISPLWSCLQNLVRFGLGLIPRTSNFWRGAGWKTGFLASGWVFTYHRLNRHFEHGASVQPVSKSSSVRVLVFCLLHRCIEVFYHRFNRCLFDSCCKVSGQLHRCFGFVSIGLTGALHRVLVSLWTTTPALVIDFVGSSGVLSPVEPTQFKP